MLLAHKKIYIKIMNHFVLLKQYKNNKVNDRLQECLLCVSNYSNRLLLVFYI